MRCNKAHIACVNASHFCCGRLKHVVPAIYVALASLILSSKAWCQTEIRGTVSDAESRQLLAGASVYIAGSVVGTVTDEAGQFRLGLPGNLPVSLIISFTGYKSDTLLITDDRPLRILLRPDVRNLNEVVVVSGTLKEVTRLSSPIPVDVYTPALFRKNPAPSLFESLALINGIQPQINCNVCNSGDIHINGMEGPYTMVLIDGMPIVSSLSTVYGLAGIPMNMVQRIEVVKGPSSTLYGSEAVAGIINVITRDPMTMPALQADISATTYGEYNFDGSARWKMKKSVAAMGLNYFNFVNRIDRNNDNFTDVTLQQRFSLFNKYQFTRKNFRPASLALRYVYEDRWGGEMQWTRQHRGGDQIYGESIYTNRFEMIGNYALPVPFDLQADLSYNYHHQDSYYGTVKYLAHQHVLFGQVRWNYASGKHSVLAGIPYRLTYYDDNTPGTAGADTLHPVNEPMRHFIPGIFVQTETNLKPTLTLLTGLRYDHHTEHGSIFSPRIGLKFAPVTQHVIRLTAGNGFRVVNLFTEDHAALSGAREVIIRNRLKPERSWNVNLNYSNQIIHGNGYTSFDFNAFYTYFTNKIVGDFMTDPDLIIYDNLAGHAVSKGLSANADCLFAGGLKIMAGITLMDVYQVARNEHGERIRTPQLFAPTLSGTYAVSYTIQKWNTTVDLTGRFTGPMHLPVVPNDERPDRSPWFTLMNVQIMKSFSQQWEFYAGLKNLLNFMPTHPILRPFDPFDRNITIDNPKGFTFDTSYNYAPIQGIRGFAGIRFTL
jgi:outer membrane receptor for ferrienterochelin and colicins